MPAWGRNARGERLGFSWVYTNGNEVSGQVEIPLGQICSLSSNRVVRTRTLRGVGAGRGNPPG